MINKITLVLFLAIIVGCRNPFDKKTITKKIEKPIIENSQPTNNINYQKDNTSKLTRINIDNELKIEWNDYMMSLKDSVLSMCNFEKLYNPFGDFSHSKIKQTLNCMATIDTTENSVSFLYENKKFSITVVNWKNPYKDEYDVFLVKGIVPTV